MATTKTQPKPKQTRFVENLRESLPTRKVIVTCRAGTMPLEWPKNPDGTRCVDADRGVVNAQGKFMVTDRIRYRNIDTTGAKGQSKGFMELNPEDHSHPLESDADFLARIKDWIDHSKDPRIEKYGVRVEEGNPFALPFARWDDLKAGTIGDMVANMLGDDDESNREMLTRFTGYELNRFISVKGEEPLRSRQDVLDVLETLASASGDESGDGFVEDDS